MRSLLQIDPDADVVVDLGVVEAGDGAAIALITEGTYPSSYGGVSVWCDQMIRGLSNHHFDVYAICASGSERSRWDLPPNVGRVVNVPIWGPSTRVIRSVSLTRRFRPVLERFLDAVLDESADDTTDDSADGSADGGQFLSALFELFEFAQRGELSAGLASDESVGPLLARLAESAPSGRETARSTPEPGTVADAVATVQLLEHFLRPLAIPPPEATLCHSVANGLGALTAMTAKWAHGTPFLMTEHGVYLRERYLSMGAKAFSQPVRWFILKFFKRLTQAGYQISDVIAPGSEYNRRWELANGAEPSRIQAIHNGVDPASFPAGGPEPDVPTLAWVGRIDPLKDVETLLRAFAEVHAEMPEARLRIFGGTPEGNEDYLQRCVDLRDSLELAAVATFEGRVASILDAYRAGHVVLLTSISEGFPYVVIEAMASGRPMVCTDVGGVSEAVGDAGMIVPPRDATAMAQACLTLLRDHDLRRRLGLESTHRVQSLFTVGQCVAAYDNIYRQIALTSSPSSAPDPLPMEASPAVPRTWRAPALVKVPRMGLR